MADNPPMTGFRPNVCIAITDQARENVLVFRRVDILLSPHQWQFPQGGIKPGETPEEGMRRELLEEIGTAAVEVLDQIPEPICYEYPEETLAHLRAQGSKLATFRGQEQHWFLARLNVGTETIHFHNHKPEFDAFEWVTPREALERVVPFKQSAYRLALSGFNLLKD